MAGWIKLLKIDESPEIEKSSLKAHHSSISQLPADTSPLMSSISHQENRTFLKPKQAAKVRINIRKALMNPKERMIPHKSPKKSPKRPNKTPDLLEVPDNPIKIPQNDTSCLEDQSNNKTMDLGLDPKNLNHRFQRRPERTQSFTTVKHFKVRIRSSYKQGPAVLPEIQNTNAPEIRSIPNSLVSQSMLKKFLVNKSIASKHTRSPAKSHENSPLLFEKSREDSPISPDKSFEVLPYQSRTQEHPTISHNLTKLNTQEDKFGLSRNTLTREDTAITKKLVRTKTKAAHQWLWKGSHGSIQIVNDK